MAQPLFSELDTLEWRPEYVAVGYGQPVGHSPVGDVEPGTSVPYEYGVEPKYDENGNYIGGYGPYELEEVQTQPSLLSQAYRRYITGPLRREGQEISNFWDDYTLGHKNMVARNPYFEYNWDMANNIIEGLGAMSGGATNLFIPSTALGFGVDLLEGNSLDDAYLKFALARNNGVVTDKFAADHPYWTAGINFVVDAATPTTVAKGVGVRLKPELPLKHTLFPSKTAGTKFTYNPIAQWNMERYYADPKLTQYYYDPEILHGRNWRRYAIKHPYDLTGGATTDFDWRFNQWYPNANANTKYRLLDNGETIMQRYEGNKIKEYRYNKERGDWDSKPVEKYTDQPSVYNNEYYDYNYVHPNGVIGVYDFTRGNAEAHKGLVPTETIVEIPVSQYITQAPDDIDDFHVVKSNDILWKVVSDRFPNATYEEIAQHINELAALNNISNPDLIYPNDTIYMPISWNIK